MALDKKNFSKRIRDVRLASGLTGAVLAEKIGVKREAVVNIESGRSGPSVDTLYALAEALNVSTDYLLGLSLPGSPPLPSWLADLLPDLGSLDKSGQEAVRALVMGLAKK